MAKSEGVPFTYNLASGWIVLVNGPMNNTIMNIGDDKLPRIVMATREMDTNKLVAHDYGKNMSSIEPEFIESVYENTHRVWLINVHSHEVSLAIFKWKEKK